MVLVTPTEFRSHIRKYLDLALLEPVRLKANNGVMFDIIPSKKIRANPSPSNDPWFDNPRNMAELDIAIDELRNGKADLREFSETELKALFAI